MARKKPKVNLSQTAKPHAGDLEGLFSSADDTEQASGLQLLALRVDAVQPDPTQPRQSFPQESLQELANSIKQDGVIQPIEVTQTGPNRYLIVHGERRWRASQLAGLVTIPAVVRRRDYDEVTRFVRQLVENIQREDLNDIDRAAGLVRLRDLMQEELDKARQEGKKTDTPWGTKITWAKVGERLGSSRQRINQLTNLLKLPDEIQDDVRGGHIKERNTRIYQGLKPSQQRALHSARAAGDVDDNDAKKIAQMLKVNPDMTVYQGLRILREPPPAAMVDEYDPAFDEGLVADDGVAETAVSATPSTTTEPTPDSLPDYSPSGERVTNAKRLSYVRQHLARIQKDLPPKERAEVLRQLKLIQGEVNSLIVALSDDV